MIAGLGSIGRRHLRNLVELGEKDILLFRTHQATLKDSDLADFPVETDLEKALAWQPDAVIVSNPTALHLSVSIPAAQAGCNLFLEKPLSKDCKDLDSLEDILLKNKKRALVGFQFRFHPALQQIAAWIEMGFIGRVISASVHWGEYLPEWHPWEDYRVSYSAREDLGGGVVLTLCHPIDYLRWLVGEVHAVSAFVGQVSDLELQVEDVAEILMEHENGAVSHIHLDYYQQPKRHEMEIIGSQGSIRWNEIGGEAQLYNADEKKWLSFIPARSFERNEMFLKEMSHFLTVLKNKVSPVCSLRDGIRVQEIIEAVYLSGKEKCGMMCLPKQNRVD